MSPAERGKMVDAVTCFLRCPKLTGAEDYNYWRASVIERLKLAGLYDAVFGDEEDETKRKLAASLIKLNIGAEAMLIAEQTTDARELMSKLEAKYVTKTIAVQIERQVELLTRKLQPEETTQELLAWLEAHYAKTFQLDATDYNAAQRLGHICLILNDESVYNATIEGLKNISKEQLDWDTIRARLEGVRRSTTTTKDNAHAIMRLREKRQHNACERCGRNNHQTAECKASVKCHKCHKYGHYQRECRSRKSRSYDKGAQPSETLFALGVNVQNNDIVIDTGATSHMFGQRDLFLDVEETEPCTVKLPDRNVVTCNKRGTVAITTQAGQRQRNITVENVLYIPEIDGNYLSVPAIAKKGYQVSFDDVGCKFRKNGNVIAKAELKDDTYILSSWKPAKQKLRRAAALTKMHQRLGHTGWQKVQQMQRENEKCEPCTVAKSTRRKRKGTLAHAKEPGEIIHTDVCGKLPNDKGAEYWVTFIDEVSRFVKVYPLARKNEVSKVFDEYLAYFERISGRRVITLHSDGGGEYIGLEEKLKTLGITLDVTPPYSSETNGIAERTNRSILMLVRVFLYQSGIRKTSWTETLQMAERILNGRPRRGNNKSPWEVITGSPDDLKNMYPFGCLAIAHAPKHDVGIGRDKLDVPTVQGIILRCERSGKHLIQLFDGRKRWTKDIVVQEETFPLRQPQASMTPEVAEAIEYAKSREYLNPASTNTDSSSEDDLEVPVQKQQMKETVNVPRQIRSGATDQVKLSCMRTIPEPETIEEALDGPHAKYWEEAIADELESLSKFQTWTLVDRPKDKQILGSKFVFKVKMNQSGEPLKFKARLVARGFQQDYFTDVYSPTVSFDSIRVVLSIAAQRNFDVQQMDVSTAYLNGELNEEIYMEMPPGNQTTDKVCKLNRGLYGLKQSGKIWYEKLRNDLQRKGFYATTADPCVFVKDNIYVLVYVDDFLLVGNKKDVQQAKAQLREMYKMKDLGEAREYLGIEISRDKKTSTVKLGQPKYIQKILEEYKMDESKPVSTPMAKDYVSTEKSGRQEDHPYRELIGALLYISTRTRPDITYAVRLLATKSQRFNNEDWQAGKRILRYLRGTINMTLVFTPCQEQEEIAMFVDASWASPRDRKSVTGAIIYLYGNPIAYISKKQTIIATSSSEAEYVAMAQGLRKMQWLQNLLTELGLPELPTKVFTDNTACLTWSTDPEKPLPKHIDIQYQYARQQRDLSNCQFLYIPTQQQVADILTKALEATKFNEHRTKLKVTD